MSSWNEARPPIRWKAIMKLVGAVGKRQNGIRSSFNGWLRSRFDRMHKDDFYHPRPIAEEIKPRHRAARQAAYDSQTEFMREMIAASRAEARDRPEQATAGTEPGLHEDRTPPTPLEAADLPDPAEQKDPDPALPPKREDRPALKRVTVDDDPRDGVSFEDEVDRAFEKFRYEMAQKDAEEAAAREAAWEQLSTSLDTDIAREADRSTCDAIAQANAQAAGEQVPDLGSMTRAEIDAWVKEMDDRYAATGEGRITGYRRVVHPELSETGVCGLCLAAAANVYRTSQVKPMHARCKCTVAPIIDGTDVGQWLNQDSLRQAGGDHGWDSKMRYRINEHGEVGAQLYKVASAAPEKPKPSNGEPWTPAVAWDTRTGPSRLKSAEDKAAKFTAIAASAPEGTDRAQAEERAAYWQAMSTKLAAARDKATQ